MYKLTDEADSDLISIYFYTLDQFGERRADSYTDSLKSACQSLADSPTLGRLCSELMEGLRRYDHSYHAIYYREDGADILIVRILHQQMDQLKHLD